MNSFLILALVSLLTIAGDYCIKLASGQVAGWRTLVFAGGVVLYALPALGWYFLMRSHSLATIGVLYSASTVIMLAVLGVFVFRESFGLREALAILLAMASVAVMSYEVEA